MKLLSQTKPDLRKESTSLNAAREPVMKSATIYLCLLALLVTAGFTEAICCEVMESQLENKTKAYKTVCSSGNMLSANCCKEIASEAEQYREAYISLCKKHCGRFVPLGMESGKIPNSAISASTFYNGHYYPYYARLNKNVRGRCGWTPTVNGRIGSWLQVDLGQMTVVTGVATQGSTCSNNELTKSYAVSHSGDGKTWTYIKEGSGIKIFPGNTDETTVVTHKFKQQIHARFMRILPKTWSAYPTTRVEFYGCRK